jgi:arsenical pump membrane protein
LIEFTAASITILAFFLTTILILWRPKGLNEAIPSTIGAVLVLISGTVTFSDLLHIGETVSGAAITIMATIIMALVLESFGFFHWAAEGLAHRSKGSGIRLFWYVNVMCFLMTLFFNNDGSILITTPILLLLLREFKLKNHQKIPYLLSGALVATASSAPIGVSNIVNLIALKMVGLNLYTHTMMMFVPAFLGLIVLVGLLFLVFYRQLPKVLPPRIRSHPLKTPRGSYESDVLPEEPLPDREPVKQDLRFMQKILLFVFIVRISLFVASYYGIPVELAAVFGSCVLLGWRWYRLKIPPTDMLRKVPWHILIFAFSMYVIIFGLHNIGLTNILISLAEPLVHDGLLNASLFMGGVMTLLSTFFNNHPALMIGTMTLTEMQLDPLTLRVSYLASVVGSDIGALLLPIGTLASLIWFHLLKKHRVKISWDDYLKVTMIVIPPTLIFTLVLLHLWVEWIY